MLRRIYLSPLGSLISLVLSFFALFHKPFMVYGFYNRRDKKFYKRTRIGSNVKMTDISNLDIKDNVWIGYFSLLDGIGGITIGKGVHIASHSCIYTHSSQNSIRLLGEKFINIPASERPGYIIEKVFVGEYTFIGTGSIILPGTHIGKGCIVGAGSVVKGNYPDFSIIAGNPAKVLGDSRETDQVLFASGISTIDYFNRELIKDGKFEYSGK